MIKKCSEISIFKDSNFEKDLSLFLQSIQSVLYPVGDVEVCLEVQSSSYLSVTSLSRLPYVRMDWEFVEARFRAIADKPETGNDTIIFKSYAKSSGGIVKQYISLQFLEDVFGSTTLLCIGWNNTFLSIMEDLEDKIFEVPAEILIYNRGPRTYRGPRAKLLWYLESLCDFLSEPDGRVGRDRSVAQVESIEPHLTPLQNSVSIHSYDVDAVYQILRGERQETE